MHNIDCSAYQEISEAVLKCAVNCFFRGKKGIEEAEPAIKEEYMECLNRINKVLNEEVNKQ